MIDVFLKIVNMSISAGWLILAVLALRLLLKKVPRWIHVLLWGIVAVRLLCPISIESTLSLIPSAETISPDIMMDWTPEISTGIPALNSAINPVISHSFAPSPSDSANPLQIWIPIASIIWAAGVVLMLLYTAVSYFSLRRKLRTAVRLRENIFQCETVSSPFVLGILKARIYLPYGIEDPHVIAHEQAHIRRKDHWWKPLGFLLLTVHWFNPLMWLGYILLCRDFELACDEKVIAELGCEQRAAYTQALVACSVNRRMIAACPLAFGEVGVKERVKSIMNYRKPTFWLVVSAVVVCIAVAVCFLTDPKSAPEFAMNGDNVSDLDPEGIVERIIRFQDIENSNVYMNSNNFSLTVDGAFNWVDSQSIRYFFYENHKVRSAQLRIFPNENDYFLTEPVDWPDQNRIFLLRHYLDAIKYLPQQSIRELAPADRYLIEQIDEGTPSDYDRVINYSSNGIGETDGWYIHLRILPHHENGEGYSGTGEEVIHLFYGDSAGDGAKMWFDFSVQPELMDWNSEREYTIDQFPGVIFRCNPYEIAVGETVLIQGMPIWSAYLDDLNCDGYPEICSETSFGSGMIDNRVIIYDYANGVSYLLEDRGYHDYFLRRNEADGHLYVDKRIYNSEELVTSDRLRMENCSIATHTEPAMILMAKLLEIHDGYFIVEPIEGSWELSSADRIEVPMRNMEPSPEPQIGDILQIEYDGMIQEVYPARITNVYRISVAEQGSVVTMVPTDTKLKGLHAGALLLPIEGKTYRYLLTDNTGVGLTPEKRIFEFKEPDLKRYIDWEVYSLREYPNLSVVMIISKENGSWFCTYSPPGRCSDTALDHAVKAGYVVMEDGNATHGQDTWKRFYEDTQNGKMASVTVAHYQTLDPDRCDVSYLEAFGQDYPSLNIYHLDFDGSVYTLSFKDGSVEYTRTYEYLMKYEDGPKYAFSSAVPQDRYQYVLTHDNRYTYDQLWMSIASSQAGAYIDHYTILSELKR